jgi:hypothetical protein
MANEYPTIRKVLEKAKAKYEKKTDEAGATAKIDAESAMLSFAAAFGKIEGEVKRAAEKDHAPKDVTKALIKALNSDYRETQKASAWEDDGLFPYPTYEDQIYSYLAESAGSALYELDIIEGKRERRI